jgi:hypothetical protein
MNFVELLFAFLSIATSRLERRRVGIELRNICEWVSNDIATNAKLVWKFAYNGTDFLRNGFVLLLQRKKNVRKVGKIRKVRSRRSRGFTRRRRRKGRIGRGGNNIINGMEKSVWRGTSR